jgi:hypothetical protein
MNIKEIILPAFIGEMKKETLDYVQSILNDIEEFDDMGKTKIIQFTLHEFVRRLDNGELTVVQKHIE